MAGERATSASESSCSLVNVLLAIFVIKGDPHHLGMSVGDAIGSGEEGSGVKSPADRVQTGASG